MQRVCAAASFPSIHRVVARRPASMSTSAVTVPWRGFCRIAHIITCCLRVVQPTPPGQTYGSVKASPLAYVGRISERLDDRQANEVRGIANLTTRNIVAAFEVVVLKVAAQAEVVAESLLCSDADRKARIAD